jgi:hypothetical protein
MTKHTPGPWGLSPCSNGGALVTRTGVQSHLQVVPEADAHLIAAAPDLLAALRDFAEVGDNLIHAELVTQQRRSLLNMLSVARAAIAKADGQQ